jgi:hypothetical protein
MRTPAGWPTAPSSRRRSAHLNAPIRTGRPQLMCLLSSGSLTSDTQRPHSLTPSPWVIPSTSTCCTLPPPPRLFLRQVSERVSRKGEHAVWVQESGKHPRSSGPRHGMDGESDTSTKERTSPLADLPHGACFVVIPVAIVAAPSSPSRPAGPSTAVGRRAVEERVDTPQRRETQHRRASAQQHRPSRPHRHASGRRDADGRARSRHGCTHQHPAALAGVRRCVAFETRVGHGRGLALAMRRAKHIKTQAILIASPSDTRVARGVRRYATRLTRLVGTDSRGWRRFDGGKRTGVLQQQLTQQLRLLRRCAGGRHRLLTGGHGLGLQLGRLAVRAHLRRCQKSRIASRRDFRWEIAHAAVSRRPPISLDRIVARNHMYTHAANVWDLSIVQDHSLSPAPNPNIVTIRNFCIAVGYANPTVGVPLHSLTSSRHPASS